MLVSIHQPHYLPWLRYLDKIARSEMFLVLDDAQYTRGGWQNRNYVKSAQGKTLLTVPVSERFGESLHEVRIAPGDQWARKHWRTLEQSYARSPFWEPGLRMVYERAANLVDLNLRMLDWQLGRLGLEIPRSQTSRLGIPTRGTRRLVDLVKSVGGTAYLTGRHALEEYLDPIAFRAAGLDLFLYDWSCPTYRQLHPAAGFVKDLATLDLLFGEGDQARAVLARGGRVTRYEA